MSDVEFNRALSAWENRVYAECYDYDDVDEDEEEKGFDESGTFDFI